MRLRKKLAAGLLVAGTIAGSGLAVASPAHAVTRTPTASSASVSIPQANLPRWVAQGVYTDLVQCQDDGSYLQATQSNIGGYQCRGPSKGPWRLWVLVTAP